DLVRAGGADRLDQRELVEQVAVDQLDVVPDVADALVDDQRGPPDQAVDPVALLQQELGQITAVLAGDAGDQRGRHGASSSRGYLDPSRFRMRQIIAAKVACRYTSRSAVVLARAVERGRVLITPN